MISDNILICVNFVKMYTMENNNYSIYLLGESVNDVQKIDLLLAILGDLEQPVWSQPNL